MSKTTVFFGAGAECGFGIGGGDQFARMVLGIDMTAMNDAVRDFYASKKCYGDESWYPNYVFKKWDDKDLLIASIKKSLLDGSLHFDNKKDYDEQVQNELNKLKKDEYDDVIRNHTGYMGLLDAHFHTLIEPRALGPQKFWNIVSCYTRAYLAVVAEILYDEEAKVLNSEKYIELLSDPVRVTRLLITTCQNDERFRQKSYYSILKKYKHIPVVTSNYTPCCEVISKRKSEQMAYVHGKLGLFEAPYEWRVYDVTKESFPDDEVLFPYIFVQSGIKPIVEETQIRAFSKMLEFYDEADKIVIVGYRINADDNHLNGIFRKMILQGKTVVYLDYDNCSADMIANRLRLKKEYSNFICRKINKESAFETFEKEIST